MRPNKIPSRLFQEQAAFGRAIAHQYAFPCVVSPTATPTLTEVGLLARLLKQQQVKASARARRLAYGEYLRAVLRDVFRVPPRMQEWAAAFVRTLTHYPPKAFTKA